MTNELNKSPPQTCIVVFDEEQYDGNWVPENLLKFCDWVTDRIAKIPQEFRSGAKIKITSNSGYEGCSYAHIEISYQRPMTPDEIRDAERAYNRQQKYEAEKERQLYERLKSKYSTGVGNS